MKKHPKEENEERRENTRQLKGVNEIVTKVKNNVKRQLAVKQVIRDAVCGSGAKQTAVKKIINKLNKKRHDMPLKPAGRRERC